MSGTPRHVPGRPCGRLAHAVTAPPSWHLHTCLIHCRFARQAGRRTGVTGPSKRSCTLVGRIRGCLVLVMVKGKTGHRHFLTQQFASNTFHARPSRRAEQNRWFFLVIPGWPTEQPVMVWRRRCVSNGRWLYVQVLEGSVGRFTQPSRRMRTLGSAPPHPVIMRNYRIRCQILFDMDCYPQN